MEIHEVNAGASGGGGGGGHLGGGGGGGYLGGGGGGGGRGYVLRPENRTGRFLAEIKSTTIETKAPSGSFEAVLSVPTLDRDREVVDAGCFDPLPNHITIDTDHAMTVEKTIGSGRPFYDGPLLKFEGTYASHPLAQMVRSLVDEGHIRTMSVSYMNGQYEIDQKDGLKHLRRAELLNAGIVGIPANREALITASKSLANTLADVLDEPKTDKALLQSAHDALMQLGVDCKHADPGEEISTDTTPETKAVAAADDAAATAEPPAAVNVVLAKARASAAAASLTLL